MSYEIIDEYFKALERLKNNTPIRLPKGSRINNDNVSLEAGRKKGTIKKSRPVFDELIEEIIKANKKDIKPIVEAQNKADKYREKFLHYKKLYEESINRELMYLERIDKLEQLLQARQVNNKNSNF